MGRPTTRWLAPARIASDGVRSASGPRLGSGGPDAGRHDQTFAADELADLLGFGRGAHDAVEAEIPRLGGAARHQVGSAKHIRRP